MTAEQERDAVVRWLRDDVRRCDDRVSGGSNNALGNIVRATILQEAADAIEAGEHIKESNGGK